MAEGATGHRQRLGQRFVAGEAQALTDTALLELVLTYAIPRKDVQPLAQHMVSAFGGLRGVLSADRHVLSAVDGVGEHAATLLQLIGWIGVHCFDGGGADGPEPGSLTSPQKTSTKDHVEHEGGPVGGNEEPSWRASGPYTATNASKNGLMEETRLALLALGQLGDRAAMRRELLDGGLPQRSRATRESIVTVIAERLLAWHPPAWVCAELVASALGADDGTLALLLLLYAGRQDALLYDIVQQVVWPRWREGVITISRVDVQRLLDDALPAHPEIDRWSLATREKLAGNLLTILRDYGLLQGNATKRIVEPVVSAQAARHLYRALREEEVPEAEVPEHSDWRLWLLSPDRVRTLLAQAAGEGGR